MKRLLILSGKGGTGKTTVAASMIRLAEARACADCDVDAPNLHLVLERGSPETEDYHGLPKAHVDEARCTLCGLCEEMCRFGAISINGHLTIDARACEGCGLCDHVCPVDAISMLPAVAGDLLLYRDPEKGVFSTAQLRMGNGTTGLLVAEVKRRMEKASRQAPLAVIDGSPGIGCPVIASISGVDMVLVVAEPSVSGISDMERILDTAEKLRAYTVVCVNKADAHPRMTERIRAYCSERDVPYVGEIPYDSEVVRAVNRGMAPVDVECPAGEAIRRVFAETMKILDRSPHAGPGMSR